MAVDAKGASRLRTVRETLGLSQREFAKELGVAPSALAQWETERRALPGPIARLLTIYEEQLRIERPSDNDAGAVDRRQPSWLTRTASTAYAGALWALLRRSEERVGASTFERSVRNAAIDKYVQTLGELRGIGLKYGQMLANADALDPLTRERGSRFSALALQATPMSSEDVLEVFLRETGSPPRAFFSEWSKTPFFAASIGQVHRARLKSGEDVAVKVQYVDIAETIRTDLRNVKVLDRLYCVIAPAQRPGTIFDELATRFVQECDYALEAERTRYFRSFFEGRKDIRVPKVIAAPSTRRILTLEWLSGRPYDEFVRSADQAARDRAGKAIWDFFYLPAPTGVFHADPHAANVLFDDHAVTFLDFGRTGHMPPAFLELWKELARAILEKDRARALGVLARMEFTRAPDVIGEDLYRLTVATHLPWLGEGPFAFTTDFAQTAWRLLRTESLRRHMNVPREAVLWHQLLLGVYALLVPLGCRVDCRTTMLRHLYDDGRRMPAPYTRGELASMGFAA